MVTVAVDAMGGDSAPVDPVIGAFGAVRVNPQLRIKLVGVRNILERECEKLGGLPENISIVHAPEVVGMHESPVDALRRKKETSIGRAVALVVGGEADAVLSAGNTGAAVVASTLGMKTLDGVKRPGIAVPIPTANGTCAVIDVGANIKCKPDHLLQYGYMGEVYAQVVLGIEKPRVGLLSIGEEDEKGNELVKVTHEMLAKSGLDFVGNIEGGEIFLGSCDVAVSEGFVGNVLLKVIEGLAESIFNVIDTESRKNVISRFGSWMCRSVYDELKAKMTYDEYGGAPLMGTDGVCVICHGRSNDKAIQNAIMNAATFVERNMTARISERIARSGTE